MTQDLFDKDRAEFLASHPDLVLPWYPGVNMDHLYPECLSRTIVRIVLERAGNWDPVTSHPINPRSAGICRGCRERWETEQRAPWSRPDHDVIGDLRAALARWSHQGSNG